MTDINESLVKRDRSDAERGYPMVDIGREPSMDDILSSIKRIIAEEGEDSVRTAVPSRTRSDSAFKPLASTAHLSPSDYLSDEILELTEEVESVSPFAKPQRTTAVVSDMSDEPSILSVESEVAARHSLSALSSLIVSPKGPEGNTLEDLVRSMLKPMLKEWLDAKLPALVEEMVSKEIARITAR